MKIVFLAPTRRLAREALESIGLDIADRRLIVVTEGRADGLLQCERGMTCAIFRDMPDGLPKDVVNAAAARDLRSIRFADLPSALASMKQ